MAEFCPECWNRLNGRKDTEKKYKMSADLDLCEGCGQWKRVIVCERRPSGLIDFLFDMHKKL